MKKNELDYLNILKVCASKNAINRVKRQCTEWENISACHLHDREFTSRIHTEFLQPHPQSQITWLKHG